MNFNNLSKQEFLDFLEKDGLEICQKGKNAFLAFRGSIYEYFANHERGQYAVNYCVKSQWFIENASKEICDLVTSATLKDSQLTRLPSGIGKLLNLTSLYLSSNQLTRFPKKFGKLINLTSLDLSDNQLTRFSPKIGKLVNLTSLDLRDNQLTSLSPEISNCQKLKYLFLYGNNFSEQEKEKIKALLPNCKIRF